ncbi:MAG: hypothetical protein JSV89_17305 [Spirochaetaceae bacterium]|nr:MAG: hypothetical protein JSV89_17305 [Spirochaetaceae bacterium]
MSRKEAQVLRDLATRWLEHANQSVMEERRRQWRAVKDLQAERPMILVETCMLSDYIGRDELVCQDPYLRNIEKSLFEIVRHADEIGDDIVVDQYFRIPWDIEISDYGVPIVATHVQACDGSDVGYTFNFGVRSEEDFKKLHLRTRCVNREETIRQKKMLEDVFGDILPVKVGGYDPFDPDPGYRPWLGNLFGGLTMDLFKLIGNNNLLLWVYDKPELIHKMMVLIRDDRQAHFRFLEQEGLLYQNLDTWMPCNGSYGFVSDLPPVDEDQEVRLKDCWCWVESQESEPISPTMFDEFFLPYIAEVTRPFGLTYYGCCEGLDDRFEYVRRAIPNLRVVSVSGWSDLFKMGEMLGKDYVYSRKPTPANISGPNPYWDLLEKDIRDTLTAARDCNLELCYRDIYTINGDRPRLRRWVEMTRALMMG